MAEVSTNSGKINVSAGQNTVNVGITKDYSQYYSQLSKDWATKTNGLVNNEDYSSKYYAEKSKDWATDSENNLNSVISQHEQITSEIMQAREDISTDLSGALLDIESNKTNSITEIKTARDNGVNAVNSALENFDNTVETAQTDITNLKNSSVEEIKAEGAEQVNTIKKTGTDELNKITQSGIDNKADLDLSNLSDFGKIMCAKNAFAQIHYDPNDFSKIGAYWAVQNLTSGSVNFPDGGFWLTFIYKYNAATEAGLINSVFELGIVPGGKKFTVEGNYPHYYFYGIRIQEA